MNHSKPLGRAALAPAEPSPQDRRVAAEASAAEIKARHELTRQRAEGGDSVEPTGAIPPAQAAEGAQNPPASTDNTNPIAPPTTNEPTGNTLTRLIASFTGGAPAAPQLDARA